MKPLITGRNDVFLYQLLHENISEDIDDAQNFKELKDLIELNRRLAHFQHMTYQQKQLKV